MPRTHSTFATIHIALALTLILQFALPARRAASAELPSVPVGFAVSVFAREPLVRNPCAMAFDRRGRLFVSQGVQYRNPTPETPGDRVSILLDEDGDGAADRVTTFADGFAHIQGLAWRGDELWVANAPDLTVVRDTDGDDVADQYRRVYGGLGNLEHGLHGLNWAPDGRLYMSKGNSRGYMDAASPEQHLAPKAFAQLWGVPYPHNAPATTGHATVTPQNYRRGYHHPSDDWGAEGGILRCEHDGGKLEIFSRGMRNPFDMAFDADFNWVATDQDQDGGDRVLNPRLGAHFGWGHRWSPHWTGEDHPPTAPISGPLFHGSGTGVVFVANPKWPPAFRNVFLTCDWLNRRVTAYRPRWQGALMLNMEPPKPLISAPNGRAMGASSGMLFDPTDIAVGPDGAVWILSWGHGYGATLKDGQQQDAGRVYRLEYGEAPRYALEAKRMRPLIQWSTDELIADLRHESLPVWRIDAQNELIRRGDASIKAVIAAIEQAPPEAGAMTWLLWTLGRMSPNNMRIDSLLAKQLIQRPLSEQIQACRILADRAAKRKGRLHAAVQEQLASNEPRLRLAAWEAVHTTSDEQTLKEALPLLSRETDRGVYYAAWRTMGELVPESERRSMLNDPRAGIRRAALLGLLEQGALSGDEVVKLQLDTDRVTAEVANAFVEISGTSGKPVLQIQPSETSFAASVAVRISMQPKPGLHIRYTLDGSEPSDTSGIRYQAPIRLAKAATVTAALFRGRERVGPVVSRKYEQQLGSRYSVSDVLPIPIGKLRVESGSALRTSRLQLGEPVYTNRDYVWTSAPQTLIGATVIQTANSDADVGSSGKRFLSFHAPDDAIVYVGHDRRIQDKPSWLAAYDSTGMEAVSSDTKFDLYAKRFSAGQIVLGGNTNDESPHARSQYVVIITAAPLRPRATPTTTDKALARAGDNTRGERLFFGQAGCGKCHRLGARGNAYAPNLSNLGQRASVKIITESILDPNAVITEGFQTLNVATNAGKLHSGFLKQESGILLQLVTREGDIVSIRKNEIEERKRVKQSAMPSDYAKLLGPQDVADLSAYVATFNQRAATPTKTQPPKQGFHIASDEETLQIHLDGRRIATYHKSHDEIQRPFFSHLRTHRGYQVTRNFPPIPGKDATDHASMHPGLWMAFGDISGSDFWRNRGRVVHRQLQGQSGTQEQASFRVSNDYLDEQSKVVCQETSRYQFQRLPEGAWLLSVDSRFNSKRDFSFGVQEEMGLGIRVATPLAVRNGGHILNSRDGKDEKGTWGNTADWWDYYAKVEEREVGVLLLAHPENGPVWGHCRDYGALVANPFPLAVIQNATRRTTVAAGKTFRLRFGVVVHDRPAGRPLNRDDIYKTYRATAR